MLRGPKDRRKLDIFFPKSPLFCEGFLGKKCLLDDNSIVNKTTLIINNFFDNVIVNDDNMELRKNRTTARSRLPN